MNKNRFDNLPAVKKSKLNILPPNPEQEKEFQTVGPGRFPSWLHRPLPKGNELWATNHVMRRNHLHTVCEEAKCPNLLECWSKKTATFLILGKECTRSCGFCSIDFSKTPHAPDSDEPENVASSVHELGLKHVVITMVARDDLPDGGAAHLAKVIEAVRNKVPTVTIETLTSDFAGNFDAIDSILNAHPEIYNYNIETVRSLTPQVRHRATYDRTLNILKYVKAKSRNMLIKSGMMVGLGETDEEVFHTIKDLYDAGCDIITIGQYLQPIRHKLRVKAFITPDQFKTYEKYGMELGVKNMYCGPFVRSSYNANLVFEKTNQPSQTINSL